MSEEKQSDDDSAMIPGVAGAVAAAANSKPGTALLTPSATALGAYLGERTEEWIARRKAKRAKNLRVHRDRVLKIDPPDLDQDGPTERQFEQAENWAAEAEAVDPERDAELSALWEGLLSSIYRDEDDIAEMMAAVRAMDRRDATVLLKLEHYWTKPHDRSESSSLARLEKTGVVERYSALEVASSVRLQSLVVALVFVAAFGFLLPGIVGRVGLESAAFFEEQVRQMQSLLWAMALGCAAVLAFAYTRFWGSFRLSPLGERLQRSALRFLGSGLDRPPSSDGHEVE